MSDVHTTHCCQFHGCKYGDDDCTVLLTGKQEYWCETCDMSAWEDEDVARMIDEQVDRAIARLTRELEAARAAHDTLKEQMAGDIETWEMFLGVVGRGDPLVVQTVEGIIAKLRLAHEGAPR